MRRNILHLRMGRRDVGGRVTYHRHAYDSDNGFGIVMAGLAFIIYLALDKLFASF